MTLRPLLVLTAVAGFCLGTALAIPAPADAAGKNKKHHVRVGGPARGATAWSGGVNGTGPLYFSQEYLGTDPDPNIRFQLLRDISGRYGGGGD